MWPDGKKETLTHLAADKFYIVREGQGIVETRSPSLTTTLP
jgi:mannose-6-phosphate isomerase-like protein (cupin superfamily)